MGPISKEISHATRKFVEDIQVCAGQRFGASLDAILIVGVDVEQWRVIIQLEFFFGLRAS